MGDKLISHKVFQTLFPRGNLIIQPMLNNILPKYGISTLNRVSAFLSQCGHESANFTSFEENLNYSASRLLEVFPKYFDYQDSVLYAKNPEAIANRVYANRMENGSESSGDGWRYRGRGLIQLTGKKNYRKFAEYKGISIDDCISYLETPQGMVESSVWFWNYANCNAPADSDDIRTLTKIINGGYNGLEHRTSLYNEAKRLLSDFLGKGEDASIRSIHINKPRIKLTKDIYRDFFECNVNNCGCGYDFVDYELVKIIQEFIDIIGNRKINIKSGTRCLKYNNIVGVPNSLHTIGKAVDISVPEDLEKKLPEMGSDEIVRIFKSISNDIYTYNIDKNTVHIDLRLTKNPKTIQVLRNISRADLMGKDNIDSLDISIYLVLKAFIKTINRDIKIIPIKREEGKLTKSISFQVPTDRNKNLPQMESDEIIKILNKLFNNVLILQKIDNYTIFMNAIKL